VRALAGEKTGFAYSDEIVLPAARGGLACPRGAIAVHGGERRVCPWRARPAIGLYLSGIPRRARHPDKIAWLERVDREARRIDPASCTSPRAVAVTKWAHRHQRGKLAADVRARWLRFNVSVAVEQGGRANRATPAPAAAIRFAELVAGERPLALAREATRRRSSISRRARRPRHHDGGAGAGLAGIL